MHPHNGISRIPYFCSRRVISHTHVSYRW